MTKIVLTGPAITEDGEIITRSALTTALREAGHIVQASVRDDTEVLVSSRTDTVKYQQAVQRGLRTMTYMQLIAHHLDGKIPSGEGIVNPFTDLPQRTDTVGQDLLYQLDVL